ncbi:hypothetical protein HJC23_012025 [Cyclotella cryptica]|uniref:Uncharacterized protein n=1 Tax=Cyclotella cryptica TaxID=29204 RepID=A0ABD3PS88_9STRA|eukprot:CCRYP_012322-RA/>CCRYP_012322-RA protein AED:0.05 eAED:0.05 QI:243/1/1/1/1/1/2/62/230
MMKLIFCICSLRAMMASAYYVGNDMGGSIIDDSLHLRRPRGHGYRYRGGMGMGGKGMGGKGMGGKGMGGKGMGGKGHGGGMMNGGGGGRMEIMRTIHNLFENRGSITREVNRTSDGVQTYTYSDDEQVKTWIVNHVTQMARLMEGGGGIRLWDDLFEKAFEYRHMNHLSFTEVDDGVQVTHEANSDVHGQERECVVAVIHEHASVVSEFITRGMEEAHSNHAVPKQCSAM